MLTLPALLSEISGLGPPTKIAATDMVPLAFSNVAVKTVRAATMGNPKAVPILALQLIVTLVVRLTAIVMQIHERSDKLHIALCLDEGSIAASTFFHIACMSPRRSFSYLTTTQVTSVRLATLWETLPSSMPEM